MVSQVKESYSASSLTKMTIHVFQVMGVSWPAELCSVGGDTVTVSLYCTSSFSLPMLPVSCVMTKAVSLGYMPHSNELL